jgi:hypothetical protein
MFLYIFQQMTYFFVVKTSPNMIGLTVKNIIKKQLNFFFKVLGVLFCTTVSMRIGWFTDVPPKALVKEGGGRWKEVS